MKFAPSQFVSNASLSVNYVSSSIDLQQVWAFSVQANYNGLVAGEFKLQASNDLVPQNVDSDSPYFSPVNWSTVSGTMSSSSQAAGSLTYFTNQVSPGYRWVRLAFTSSSGTGTLVSANISTKG